MNARTLSILVAVVVAAAGGCKGRARFKPRATGALKPLHLHAPHVEDDFDRTLRAQLREDLEAERVRREARDDLKAVLESTIERSCRTSTRTRYLEPQGAGLQALFRTMRRVNAPADVTVPAAVTVLGLPVQAMAVDVDGARWCVDGDAALVAQLEVVQEPAADALVKVAPGAWLVLTKPNVGIPASSALVSEPFLARLGVKHLVALAPTDQAIGLADASNADAIRQMAKALEGHVDMNGADGVFDARPLELVNGSWRAWQPASIPSQVARVKKLAEELETTEGATLVNDVAAVSTTLDLLGTAGGLPPMDLKASRATTRFVDEKKRVVVEVDAASEEPQLVGAADVVKVTSYAGASEQVDWRSFSTKAGGHLTPVRVDGAVVPRLFTLHAAFTWPGRR
ncbi:MAG: hypothetical protein JNM69_36355 [Archangium sp.]|nr:hypothetical protein [Archangium sp.]